MAKNKNNLIILVFIGLAISIFGLSFDAFWHLSRGRETFLALPHLFIYGGVIIGMYGSWIQARSADNHAWLWMFRLLCAIPIFGALDEIWHSFKGVETIDSPSIIWSPPHLLIAAVGLSALLLFSLIVKREAKNGLKILGPVTLGLFLSSFLVVLGPFSPIGPMHILEISGIGVISAAVIVTLFLSHKLFQSVSVIFITIGVATILQLIMMDANYYISPDKNYLHIPDWLLVLYFFTPAIALAAFKNHHPLTSGMLGGLLAGLLLYGLGGWLIPGNDYTYLDLWIGSLFSGIGGVLAGYASEYITIRE
jgi:hypothetical protein